MAGHLPELMRGMGFLYWERNESAFLLFTWEIADETTFGFINCRDRYGHSDRHGVRNTCGNRRLLEI
jgi:hypothetical protein